MTSFYETSSLRMSHHSISRHGSDDGIHCEGAGPFPRNNVPTVGDRAADLAGAESERKMTMRTLLILTVGLSASAFAQTAAPKSGKLKQAKPSAQLGCKLVKTVKGTKIWAGDCAGPSELRGSTPGVESSQQADPPAPKQ
jgi:hypothetical protein